MQEKIIIKGAREHNLKNINLELPRNKMIVFTGLSGSGKSSLAFDTIFAEGQRRYIESLSAYARQFLGQMQKPDVDEIEGLSPAISIDQKAHSSNPRSTVATITEIYDYLRVLFARIGKPFCPECGAEINKMTVDEIVDAIIFDAREYLAVIASNGPAGREAAEKELMILAPVVRGRKGEYYQLLYDFYNAGYMTVRLDGRIHSLKERINLKKNLKHNIDIVIDRMPAGLNIKPETRMRLSEAVEAALKYSEGLVSVICPGKKEKIFSSHYSCPNDGFSFPEIEPRLFSFNSPYGYCPACVGLGTKELFSEELCAKCGGRRLNNMALSVKIAGKNIADFAALPIREAHDFMKNLGAEGAPREFKLKESEISISSGARVEILNRLQFMLDVGLHYLTLERRAGTLSGGEAQRIRLASQVGTRLVGALYVLDEPTIGLHQKDNDALIKTLLKLRDIGNTIIVVEHDEDTIYSSDWVVDIGPGAGKHGGYIVAEGPLEKVVQSRESLTAKYLRGELKINVPKKRRESGKALLKVRGATEHNLKNLNVDIPLGRFVCITGVSGSGKSTLMNDVIYKEASRKFNGIGAVPAKVKGIVGWEHLDGVRLIDQSPIGRTPRSNPATYTGAFMEIRDLFAMLPEARVRGYKPGRFSFNVPGGRCEHCEGNGQLAIEMHFLPTVFVRCDVCKGARFSKETLEVEYKEKNISDVLNMTIEEAEEFFEDVPYIHDKLKILNEVGLDYLELGQSAVNLSGGEAQRIKLGKELARRARGKYLYLLDEPTTGLHFHDVKKLLDVLHTLVDRGNTVVVIEHNLDVIKTADWIIDLGYEGGDKGGEVVAKGTPEEIIRKAGSFTGQYLKRVLARN